MLEWKLSLTNSDTETVTMVSNYTDIDQVLLKDMIFERINNIAYHYVLVMAGKWLITRCVARATTHTIYHFGQS